MPYALSLYHLHILFGLVFVSICWYVFWFVFFFKQKTAYELRISDWSSDVCSSDLQRQQGRQLPGQRRHLQHGADGELQRHRLAQGHQPLHLAVEQPADRKSVV